MIYNRHKSETSIIQLVLFRILLSIKDTVFELFPDFSFIIRFYRLSFLTFRTLEIVLYLHNNIRPSSATLFLTSKYLFEYLFQLPKLILVPSIVSKCMLLIEAVPLSHESHS